MSVFGVILVHIFLIQTEYEEILRITPYSVRLWKNTDQNNSEYGHLHVVKISTSINAPILIKQNYKLIWWLTNTAWKVSVFGVILVRIFCHLDWIVCGKIWIRITPNADTFYAVKLMNLVLIRSKFIKTN